MGRDISYCFVLDERHRDNNERFLDSARNDKVYARPIDGCFSLFVVSSDESLGVGSGARDQELEIASPESFRDWGITFVSP
jgi:hypothetical protein